ncbi:MAG TPA: FeoB-associated Cys-rich membrane protein [Candidatus Blautia faecavium]|uniref:FeoB-associated Cys-rich membrane protein n=1 Tax=Candidatus Blautia faecavium TaxID=2838487 RepID=A0A9D2LVN7_9FIRM|nr:FeoB-associated Cys-rich membrane protein [Candidatus Blautia faecavium]
MIVDILILLIVFGLVGFVLYRKWKNRKAGGCGCGCCKDCPKGKRGVEFKE